MFLILTQYSRYALDKGISNRVGYHVVEAVCQHQSNRTTGLTAMAIVGLSRLNVHVAVTFRDGLNNLIEVGALKDDGAVSSELQQLGIATETVLLLSRSKPAPSH